jgi:hypothetical protein
VGRGTITPPQLFLLSASPDLERLSGNQSLSVANGKVGAMLRQKIVQSAWRCSRLAGRASRGLSTTAQRPADVELTIDGKKVSIEAGSALIQACEKAGVSIPRYCYHEYVSCPRFPRVSKGSG